MKTYIPRTWCEVLFLTKLEEEEIRVIHVCSN